MQSKSSSKLLALAAVALASLVATTAAQAQTVIGALPYTISSSGNYVLSTNLNSTLTSGVLITVNASNVTIDFQGYSINGPTSAPTGQLTGIYAYEKSNVTVKNGIINHCDYGIDLVGNGNSTTANVNGRIDNMKIYAYSVCGVDLLPSSPSCIVSNSQISQIDTGFAATPVGIYCGGTGTTIQGCTINCAAPAAGYNSYGISATAGCFERENQISNANYGISGGIYQDNLASNCTTAFVGGTDAGGNTHN